MTESSMIDAAGRRRSPATMPGYNAGRPPRNKGMRYPADPPTVEEIVAVMRHAADDRHGFRVRAMIVARRNASAQDRPMPSSARSTRANAGRTPSAWSSRRPRRPSGLPNQSTPKGEKR
jgi:hypothetical protein